MEENKDALIAFLQSERDELVQKLEQSISEFSPQKFMTKPKDIPVLTLQELHEFTASTRLNQFFELVEGCTENDQLRVQVAKGRVDINLVALIQNAKGRIQSWDDFKDFFQTELSVGFNQDRAWQELEAQKYDWSESPQAFAHRLLSQYAVLKNNFPQESFPHKIRTIKRKLFKGMPERCQESLEGYMENDYPLDKFMDRLDHERQFFIRTDERVQMVKSDKGKVQKSDIQVGQEELRKDLEGQITCLSHQIADLSDAVSKTLKVSKESTLINQPQAAVRPPSRYQKGPYCAYCQKTTHNLVDCRFRPPKGHCFECRQPGCWRGKVNCPGKTGQSAARTPSQDQNVSRGAPA